MLQLSKGLHPQNSKLRAAVIGAGEIATGIGGRYGMSHIESYSALPDDVELRSFAEISEDRRRIVKESFPFLKAYKNIEDLFAGEKIDILSICTPDDAHEKLILKALDYGVKGIWCEKPMADTIKGAEEIIRKSKNAGIAIQVNYFRRFIPEMHELKMKVLNGSFGDIRLMSGYYADTYAHNGSHLLDLMLFFCGSLTLIYAHAVDKMSREKDGPVFMECQAAKGIPCFLKPFPMQFYNIFELEIFCEYARLKICENGRRIEISRAKKDEHISYLKILNSDPEIIKCRWKDSFKMALTNLIDVVKGRVDATISPPQHSLFIANVIQNVKESLA
ncbi:MAG: Gfo/Idh/MocA family oxidoreductase [Nitrospirae bacterium]|nr:Gfo/Idh/MocA family oxidoreductase [Nitrospirota bacterium]